MSQQHSNDQVVAAAAAFAAGEVTYDEATAVQLPPVPDSEAMVPLGIRVPAAVYARVKAASSKAGVPYSQLCREWIEQGLTEQDQNVLVPLSVLNRLIAHAAQSGQAA
ncbi:hypothetical protein ACWKSP_31855 [Micromonosporaceae bacterium Da 78-11]